MTERKQRKRIHTQELEQTRCKHLKACASTGKQQLIQKQLKITFTSKAPLLHQANADGKCKRKA